MGATARRFGPIAVPRGWAVAAILALLVLGAGLVRAAPLWPEAAGLQESPYDDEGVYAAAAQLLAQGAQPYRDFIYAHPPLGPPLLLPATLYHFTPWGSPTSFMMLRYAAVAYSALTVGLLFLLSWRLWGLAGGLFSGLLLLLDPASVWAGRHVMLEGPLLCLLALAALLYALARERARPPAAFLAAAGFAAAAAGGVKLQGLLLLAAFLLDLAARRRWRQALAVLAGAALLWAPLWGYLFALRAADPLGQFIWLQLLRPADGAVGLADRLRSIGDEAPLVLAAATLALLAAPAFRRPSGPPRLAPAWSLLPWWTLLVALTLLSSRSFYAHYVAHLALPLAALAGALPAALGRLLRAGGRGRAVGVAAAVVALLVLAPPAYNAAAGARRPHPDRLYQILGRYAGDAVQPGRPVFALDAQIPFRAARPPARADRGRFIVDSYGMLLYHGLGIEGLPVLELARRAAQPLPPDPYAVMWRPRAQELLRESMARADLVVIDKTSDGRLTPETREWLAGRARLEEKQERYAIYRIAR